MRFKPRIITPDNPPPDDDGQLQLPEDLQLLGRKLQAQARQLAETYPPQSTSAVTVASAQQECDPRQTAARPPKKQRQRRLWLPACQAAAAVLILVALWQQIANRTINLPQNASETKVVQREPAPRNDSILDISATWARKPAAPETTGEAWPRPFDVWPDWQTSPSAPQFDHFPFLDEITGPELEGFIDLWDLQPVSEAMVAI